MRFRRRTKLEYGLEQIDIAPLVDVIFQLLIFFMLSSSFTYHSSINVKLPKAVTSDLIKQENFVVTVTEDNVLYLNGDIISLKDLKKSLSTYKKDQPILIKSDRRAYLGRIVDVWDLCRNLGIDKINIATDQNN
ncbi:MAG: biopolymer transporter ExbD [Candidatus Omnitrophica bacterium]|nr:biopolymer transporter ExbD [Candidatus Omnitrophota bacterium]